MYPSRMDITGTFSAITRRPGRSSPTIIILWTVNPIRQGRERYSEIQKQTGSPGKIYPGTVPAAVRCAAGGQRSGLGEEKAGAGSG